MKNIFLLIVIVFLTFFSCSEDITEMNKNPDIVDSPTLEYLLTHNQIQLLESRYPTNFLNGFFVNILSDYGGNLENTMNSGFWAERGFVEHYSTTIKNITAQILSSKEPEDLNFNSMARIMRVYIFQRLTDMHGDIPYFEAGLGAEEGILEPAYDTQEDIYMDFLKELDEAVDAFNTSAKVPGSGDIVYGGDLEKWKRFGNSLMLRVALRLSDIKPELSEQYSKKAINKGVMDDFEDSFVVDFFPNTNYATTANGNAKGIMGYDRRKLSELFIDKLKSTNDPRLSIYSDLPNSDNSLINQQGLPFFTNESGIVLTEYSRPNPNGFANYDSPYIHMSHAQVEFMLTEVAERGWVISDAAEHYNKGITSSMQLLNKWYSKAGLITEEQISGYLAENPYEPENFEAALELISTQYWIDTFYNFIESFANWRRTDYPLIDNHDTQIPLRWKYPSIEYTANAKNLEEALSRMGGEDSWYTRVWWDVD